MASTCVVESTGTGPVMASWDSQTTIWSAGRLPPLGAAAFATVTAALRATTAAMPTASPIAASAALERAR
jgi:hypothetical protein